MARVKTGWKLFMRVAHILRSRRYCTALTPYSHPTGISVGGSNDAHWDIWGKRGHGVLLWYINVTITRRCVIVTWYHNSLCRGNAPSRDNLPNNQLCQQVLKKSDRRYLSFKGFVDLAIKVYIKEIYVYILCAYSRVFKLNSKLLSLFSKSPLKANKSTVSAWLQFKRGMNTTLHFYGCTS